MARARRRAGATHRFGQPRLTLYLPCPASAPLSKVARTGTWRTDDGASYTGTVTGEAVTVSPPTPGFVIPEFTVTGSNQTGSVQGSCTGQVVEDAAHLLELSTHCILRVAGAALAADEQDTSILAFAKRQSTPDGLVYLYRGAF